MSFRDAFCKNFYVTTCGFFSNPALLCTVMEMGVDRILFAVDWPFVMNQPATAWVDTIPLSDEDKVKILIGQCEDAAEDVAGKVGQPLQSGHHVRDADASRLFALIRSGPEYAGIFGRSGA